MCWVAAIPIALSLLSGAQQANAQRQAGAEDERVAKQNAQIAATQAESAKQIGNLEALKHRQQVRQFLGRQRAALAANNVDTGTGTALDLQAETAGFGAADELAIQANAARQAWGYNVEGAQSLNRGSFARRAAKQQATGTLLTTAANAASSYFGGK